MVVFHTIHRSIREKQGRPRNTYHVRWTWREAGCPTTDEVHTEREFITGEVFPGLDSSIQHTNNKGDLGIRLSIRGNAPQKMAAKLKVHK